MVYTKIILLKLSTKYVKYKTEVIMMKQEQFQMFREKTLAFFDQHHIVLTEDEKATIEVADFGLDDLDHIGLQLVTYVNTDRYCAKEMVLFPHQTCPEHRHPNIGGSLGKEETFRCRAGKVYLYIGGESTSSPKAKIPADYRPYFTAWHEIILNPGDQYTLKPNTLHWFQAGPDGAIISEFSSTSRDESDIFTDPNIIRIPSLE